MSNFDRLIEIQRRCAEKVRITPLRAGVKHIAGMDLTFKENKKNPTEALASIVILDAETLKPVEYKIFKGKVNFPYIPTFLAFRELPLLLKIYKKTKIKPDVFLIDGQGLAHPRRCGLATHFGVITDTIAIGVAKNLLYGKPEKEPCKEKGCYSLLKLSKNNEIVGAVVRTRPNKRCVYVSIGNKITLEDAINLVLKVSKYRIPEPLRLAHNLLQKARKKLGW